MTRKTKAVQGVRKTGARIAPAVALLLLGDSAYAQDREDFSVTEPSTLGLLAAGAAVGGIAAYVRSKHRK